MFNKKYPIKIKLLIYWIVLHIIIIAIETNVKTTEA